MRKWRVGTLSMGLALVFLGAALLFSQLTGILVMQNILKWWPMILIILGIETLVCVFLQKQEDAKVQYDIFSIFIISFIMVISVCFYSVISIFQGDTFNKLINSISSKYEYSSRVSNSADLMNKDVLIDKKEKQ